jgi:hypothetical protein
MIPARGLNLWIFIEGGEMEGLRVLDRTGWSGRGIACPRSLFRTARQRDEFTKPAVYILIGPAQNTEHSTRIYIGECDSARHRLSRHVRGKEFWTDVVLFCAKDETLNKGHFRYLEARLLKLAREARNAELENDNKAAGAKLSKVDSGEADAFLEEMLLFLSCIGVHAFEAPDRSRNGSEAVAEKQIGLFAGDKKSKARSGNQVSVAERFRLRASRIRASGVVNARGFLVQKGSQAMPSSAISVQAYIERKRQRLLADGVFKANGKVWELTEDHKFDSPTTAAAVLLGRSANGRIKWETDSGSTLRQVQDAAAGVKPKSYRWN